MSARRVIGVDIDGVLADFVTAFAIKTLQVVGKQVPTVATTWDWYIGEGLLDRDEEKKVWGEIEAGPEFWVGLPSLPGAVESLAMLNSLSRRHDIYYITTRPPGAKNPTERWLEEWGAERPTVLITSQKGKVCQGLGVDLFIDDKVENCLEVYRALPEEARVYLYAQPWNEAVRKEWEEEGRRGVRIARTLREVWEEEGL